MTLFSGEQTVVQEPSVERALWRDPVIWLLVILGLLFRVVYNLALHTGGDPTSSFIIDEREYFGAAHMLAEGRGFLFFDTALWVRPPLYVMLLAAIVRFAGTDTTPVLLLQSLLSAATLLPVGWLAWRVGGRGAARWTVGFGAFFLPFTLFAGLLLSETLFTLLLAVTLVALVRARERFDMAGLRGSAIWLVGAGALLGLSALTRATALGFVPLAALWFFYAVRKGRRGGGQPSVDDSRWTALRPRLLGALILLAACLFTLVPWTVRNYAVYGKFVAIDTTGGYNLWLASVGVKDEERLQADYRAIPNQADRQLYAYSRALENIGANPLGFVSKGLKESLDLWQPQFGAEERQVKGYALGRAPDWHLASLFLLDDVLYIVILCVAVAGFALASPHSLKWLTGLWVLLWIVISSIFFAVTRFRLPVVAALLPWAGVGMHVLTTWRGRAFSLRKLPLSVKLASPISLFVILLITVPQLSVSDTVLGIERWGQQASYREGEKVMMLSTTMEAPIRMYSAANQDIADTRYALAAAYVIDGQDQHAMALLRSDEPVDRFEPLIIRGDVARRAGDLASARSFFNAREVNVAGDAALEWAWNHLRPPSVSAIELGSGLDLGYVRGFYGAEKDKSGVSFRWSGEHAEIRGLAGAPSLKISWSGWRPSGLPLANVASRGSSLGKFGNMEDEHFTLVNNPIFVDTQIRSYLSGPYIYPTNLILNVNSFIGAGSDPRLLGLRVSKVEAAP